MIDMEISSEQRQIVDSVQNLLADALPYDRFVPRPTPVPNADRAVFTQFGELGVFGLGLAEASGGVGYSLVEEVLVARECGRFLVSRSEEHTSELQSLMRISYAVFCLKKKIEEHYANSIS